MKIKNVRRVRSNIYNCRVFVHITLVLMYAVSDFLLCLLKGIWDGIFCVEIDT